MKHLRRLVSIGIVTVFIFLAAIVIPAKAEDLKVEINFTSESGTGESIGFVTLEDTEYGLLLTPDLSNLSPGVHGFHIHVNPDCGIAEKEGEIVPGLAAGGHYDPENAGQHKGPYKDGHLGDLPPLFVDQEGNANIPVLAPRVAQKDISDRSLIIHKFGDNYADDPLPLGGGGPRTACGIIDQT